MQGNKLKRKLSKFSTRKSYKLKFFVKNNKFYRKLWKVDKAMNKYGGLLRFSKIFKTIDLD